MHGACARAHRAAACGVPGEQGSERGCALVKSASPHRPPLSPSQVDGPTHELLLRAQQMVVDLISQDGDDRPDAEAVLGCVADLKQLVAAKGDAAGPAAST